MRLPWKNRVQYLPVGWDAASEAAFLIWHQQQQYAEQVSPEALTDDAHAYHLRKLAESTPVPGGAHDIKREFWEELGGTYRPRHLAP